MNQDQFWELIETSRHISNNDQELQLKHLQQTLETLPATELIAFQQHFNQLFKVSYRADLWGAAFLMNGGASDDGFDYFRGWLILRGRSVFEAALENPDSLAETVPEGAESDFGFENEDILNLASRIWQKTTGQNSDAFYEQLGKPPAQTTEFGDLDTWSLDGDADPEKCPKVYPKLWEKFGW